MSAKAPSNPPNQKPDHWRERLKTFADRNHLTFKSVEEQDKEGVWWSNYHLPNPDGSKYYLGSHSGTTKAVAKEYAAKQSYEVLVTVVDKLAQDAMANAAASTSTAVNAYSAPQTVIWTEELKRVAEQRKLTFVCEEEQGPQQTSVATYHLTNSDGSKSYRLGSQSAATSDMAKEYAAYQAVGTLNMWWPSSAGGSTGAGPSGN